MLSRQFKRLANLSAADRDQMLVDGLRLIGDRIEAYVSEWVAAESVGANRACKLLRNTAREEAGKFLLLLDHYRDPAASQAQRSKHFARAGQHLSKLIYAQIADYSIASFAELTSAVDRHRNSFFLDGPNDIDFIFSNELIRERESALYVDLVDYEGDLEWDGEEHLDPWPANILDRGVRLCLALRDSGMVSKAGFRALEDAWDGFDPHTEPHFVDWRSRTMRALKSYSDATTDTLADEWGSTSGSVAQLWPMPMTRVDVSPNRNQVSDLQEERERRWEATLAFEYGIDDQF